MPVANFNAIWDASSLNQALRKGDKKSITHILCKRSLNQRLEIVAAYKTKFGNNLTDEIKAKISGDVKNVFISLLMPIAEMYCRHLRKAQKDGFLENIATTVLTLASDFIDEEIGDDELLIEMMCTMTNSEIRKICATYQQVFGKRLESSILEDQKGNFKRLLKILAMAEREEFVFPDAVTTDAEALHKHLTKILTDEKSIIEILCRRSFGQIKLVGIEYQKIHGIALDKSIKRNVSDSLKDGLVSIVRIASDPSEYYARRISKAINKHLIGDRTLARHLVVRCENDLIDIKTDFNRIFRKTLGASVKSHTSGSYKQALLTLLDEV